MSVIGEKKIKNIIIDIRGNAGGTDEYFQLFSFFSSRDLENRMRWRNLFTNINERLTEKQICKGSNESFNIVLLIDGNVFSTADGLAKYFKRTGFATLIGEDTKGEGDGLTPIEIKLKTGINVSISLPVEAPINELGEIDYTKYNTKPDIYCKEGQDLLQLAKDVLLDKYIR